MRKIAASYIFPGNRPPIKNGILVCENDGTILEIVDEGEIKEQHGLEHYNGILVPGFVNTHCHLELSNLKGKIEENVGIGQFLGKVNELRNQETDGIEEAIQLADRKMWAEGIAAVGDISNSSLSIKTKLKSKIYYHTFVESFGFDPSRSEKAFSFAENIQHVFWQNELSSSITPHSPYSVSLELFEKLKENALKEESILTIHNQESRSEAEFFKDGTGSILNHIQNNLKIDTSHWKPTGRSSLISILNYLPAENPLILVHNTFTGKEDLDELINHRSMVNTYFAFCPNSNLYIENELPNVELFRSLNLKICIGTDSLASNNSLSILSEIRTLQSYFPTIELEELLKWAGINGAKALGFENIIGTFEKGKKPGISLISGIDYKAMKLTENSKVKRLL